MLVGGGGAKWESEFQGTTDTGTQLAVTLKNNKLSYKIN